MTSENATPIFDTDKRIRLGIWGLGRGMSFFRTCRALNIDVVAGCDFNAHMRNRFSESLPDAFVTADADAFLDRDMDAVLVATYCTEHAGDAIRCLEAGRHVLSEVTAFHTLAEGVALVEAVEASGCVYNLAENYPWTKANMYLADLWRRGLFGELMYAEYEYVHECRSLAYTYIDGTPVMPGNTVHFWRSWLNFHYYNTHSLGPVMIITDTRPTRVVALPGHQRLAGYLQNSPRGMGGIAPSLITMSNGGLMRNLMGATTNDSHTQRLWGTLGAAEIHNGLTLRLGAAGQAPKLAVEPTWPMLADHAAKTGHGGGDFWCLYFFAREILTGEPAPFDVYTAADCTIPGILACRSSLENGMPYDIPDLRDADARDRCRTDHVAQDRYDVAAGCFPADADPEQVDRFTAIMKDTIQAAVTLRAYNDWQALFADCREKTKIVDLADRVLAEYDKHADALRQAQHLADAYPGSDGAQVLTEMLDLARADEVLSPSWIDSVRKRRGAMAADTDTAAN